MLFLAEIWTLTWLVVAFVELCERFAYYGYDITPEHRHLKHYHLRPATVPEVLKVGQREATGLCGYGV